MYSDVSLTKTKHRECWRNVTVTGGRKVTLCHFFRHWWKRQLLISPVTTKLTIMKNSRVSVNAFKNSSWRNDVICIIWRRWPSSKLIEMMASYLTITSNYRNKCWFIVNYPRTCFNVVQNSNISKNTFKNVLYQSFKHYASLSIFGFGMGFGCVPNLLIMIPCAVLEPDAQFASIERFIGARLKTRICLQMWNWMVFVVRIQEIILKPVEP